MSWFGNKRSSSWPGGDDDAARSPDEVAGTIVKQLVSSGAPQSITDLQATSEVPFGTFAQGLSRATESGYVELIGDPGKEQVVLTARGEEVAHQR